MPARASPCSTATCACSPGTAPSSTSTSCRRNSCASASASTRSSASTPSAAPTAPARSTSWSAQRLHSFVHDAEPQRLRLQPTGRVIEIRSNQLPDGGFVTTYTDVTETVAAEEARERANELLEQRVRERTEELTRLNAALTAAKAEADEANISKTRFLAAASHDILQPLNAARLYASLAGRARRATRGDAGLAENVDASLDAVEEILTALLDISRLDTGAMKPQWSSFRIDEMFRQLQREFEPVARRARARPALRAVVARRALGPPPAAPAPAEPGLERDQIHAERAACWSGARRRGAGVCARGLGHRPRHSGLEAEARVPASSSASTRAPRWRAGLGLGLSIVERIARVLDHRITRALGAGPRLGVPRRGAARGAGGGCDRRRVKRPRDAGARRSPASSCSPSTTSLRSSRACARCSPAGAARSSPRPGSTRRSRRSARARTCPSVIIADYHLDEGDGLDAIAALARAAGAGGAGRPGDGRPLAGGARAAAAAQRPRPQQAAEARRAAGAPGAVARDAHRGGVILPPPWISGVPENHHASDASREHPTCVGEAIKPALDTAPGRSPARRRGARAGPGPRTPRRRAHRPASRTRRPRPRSRG